MGSLSHNELVKQEITRVNSETQGTRRDLQTLFCLSTIPQMNACSESLKFSTLSYSNRAGTVSISQEARSSACLASSAFCPVYAKRASDRRRYVVQLQLTPKLHSVNNSRLVPEPGSSHRSAFPAGRLCYNIAGVVRPDTG